MLTSMKASRVSQPMVFTIFVMFAVWAVVALMEESHNPTLWPASPLLGFLYIHLAVAMMICTLAVFFGYLVNRKRMTSIGAGAIAAFLFACLAGMVAAMLAWGATQPPVYGTKIGDPETEALVVSIPAAIIAMGMAAWNRTTAKPFRGITIALALVAFGLLSAVRPLESTFGRIYSEDRTRVMEELASLPEIDASRFRTSAYIRVAAHLQEIGRTRARNALLRPGMIDLESRKVIVLCSLLFTGHGNSDSRRPTPGAGGFLGGTTAEDWPFEPIELIDGIPFTVMEGGYSFQSSREDGHEYLYHRMLHFDWNKTRLHEPTMQQKRDALAKLIASPIWKRPLEAREREWLSAQIE